MHESSLVGDLIAKVREASGDALVAEVRITLGALSNISRAHFAEHFAAAVAGTPLAGADLVLTEANDVAHPDAQEVVLEAVVVNDT